jgi:hypothetical protein
MNSDLVHNKALKPDDIAEAFLPTMLKKFDKNISALILSSAIVRQFCSFSQNYCYYSILHLSNRACVVK